MRTGAILCLLIFLGWMALALLQPWAPAVTAEVFFKLSITALGLLLAASAVTLLLHPVGASASAGFWIDQANQG